MQPIEKNPNRKNFYDKLDTMEIIENIEKNTVGNKYKRMAKEILYKTKIFRYVKKIKG